MVLRKIFFACAILVSENFLFSANQNRPKPSVRKSIEKPNHLTDEEFIHMIHHAAYGVPYNNRELEEQAKSKRSWCEFFMTLGGCRD